jgi:hypothetical protein
MLIALVGTLGDDSGRDWIHRLYHLPWQHRGVFREWLQARVERFQKQSK